jgi:hypothetical protein
VMISTAYSSDLLENPRLARRAADTTTGRLQPGTNLDESLLSARKENEPQSHSSGQVLQIKANTL